MVDDGAEPLLEEGERPQLAAAPRPAAACRLPELGSADGDPALPQHLRPRRPEQAQLPEVAQPQLVLLPLGGDGGGVIRGCLLIFRVRIIGHMFCEILFTTERYATREHHLNIHVLFLSKGRCMKTLPCTR